MVQTWKTDSELKVRNHFALGFYGFNCWIQSRISAFLFKQPNLGKLKPLKYASTAGQAVRKL